MASPGLLTHAIRSVAINCGWGIALGSIFFFTADGQGAAWWLKSVAVSTTYSNFIGLPATLIFVSMAPRFRRFRPMTQVLAYLGVLMPVAALGCAAADAFFVAIGLRPREDFVEQLLGDARVTLVIALMVGFGVIGYERLRGRLADAETRCATRSCRASGPCGSRPTPSCRRSSRASGRTSSSTRSTPCSPSSRRIRSAPRRCSSESRRCCERRSAWSPGASWRCATSCRS